MNTEACGIIDTEMPFHFPCSDIEGDDVVTHRQVKAAFEKDGGMIVDATCTAASCEYGNVVTFDD